MLLLGLVFYVFEYRLQNLQVSVIIRL